jgi:hypothetical protein
LEQKYLLLIEIFLFSYTIFYSYIFIFQMALVTAKQLTAGPAEKEEKFVKTKEAYQRASNKKPSQAKPRPYVQWPNGQRDPCRFHEINSYERNISAIGQPTQAQLVASMAFLDKL